MSKLIQNAETEFIKAQNEMILSGTENQLGYNCKISYASPDGRHLYFFSRTAARHCQVILNYPVITATILEGAGIFGFTKGIRLTGKVERVCGEAALQEAAACYTAQFPATKKMIAAFLPLMTGPGAPATFYRVSVESVAILNPVEPARMPEFAAT